MAKKKKVIAKKEDILRIASFILFNASLFHEVLAGVRPEIDPISSLSDPLKDSLIKEWKKILKIDYAPIFKIGLRILKKLPSAPKIEYMLKEITDLSTKIASSGTYLRHDLMGRIYHRLLLRTTGGYYATYYTSIPAAVLLSTLIVKTPNSDNTWEFDNEKFLQGFRIIDPACGSGTLLSAIYSSIRNEFLLKSTSKDIKTLHKILLEKSIYGLDILDYASHLTLTSLSLHNPKASFDSANIYTLPIGTQWQNVYLGSLDYLRPEEQLTLLGKGWKLPAKKYELNEVKEIYEPIELKPESFDIVIMNPPFSRSAKPNIKFGFAIEEVKKLMNKKLGEISKSRFIELRNNEKIDLKGIGQAGLGAYFVFVADRLLKNGGRLGLVIPRTLLSGVSWEKVRRLLYWNYEIEYIISNSDPGDRSLGIEGWNWSENTDLSEVLIVARKTNRPIGKRRTLYINFWNKPSNAVESVLVSQQIQSFKDDDLKLLTNGDYRDLVLDNKEIGSLYCVKQKDLSTNWLHACLFTNPELQEFVSSMRKKFTPLLVQLKNIKEIEHFGIDCGSVSRNFKPTNMTTKMKAVWGYGIKMNKMEIPKKDLKYVRLKPKSSSKSVKKGNLLIPYTMYLQNHKICAFYAPEDVISNTFWTVKVSDELYAKLIILWLNSTFGLIELLSQGLASKGFHFEFKQANIRKIKVPNLEHFKDKFASLYKETKNQSINTLAEEFQLAAEGKGIKKKIDDFFIKELKLKIDLTPYYKILSKEPILTLKRL